MNKITLIKIMENILDLYLKNELNTDTFNDIVNNQKNSNLTEDAVSYNEAEFISILFKRIPYYRIMSVINGIITTLNLISTVSKQKCISDLIEAYLSDLFPSIYARLTTEVNTHIGELLTLFYQHGELKYDDTIKRLTKNIINPNYLASMDTAEQIDYIQETIFYIDSKKEPLREKISRANFNKRNSVERVTLKTLTTYYDENLYQELTESLKDILAEYSKVDKKEASILKDELFSQLGTLHIKAQKKWNEPKPIDENQLTLKLF